VSLVGADGQAGRQVKGAPLANGESVRTQKDAYAVVAFRDRTVVTVIADSEFKLENVRFSAAQPASDNFLVRIVKGGARALTGALGQARPEVGTDQRRNRNDRHPRHGRGRPARTGLRRRLVQRIGVRLYVGRSGLLRCRRPLAAGREGPRRVHNAARDRFLVLDKVPEFFVTETAPRPDTLTIDFDNLFGTASLDGTPPGLYVLTREGHIELASEGRSIDLGPGDSGYTAEGRRRSASRSRRRSCCSIRFRCRINSIRARPA
jgi:hypothetical protein